MGGFLRISDVKEKGKKNTFFEDALHWMLTNEVSLSWETLINFHCNEALLVEPQGKSWQVRPWPHLLPSVKVH